MSSRIFRVIVDVIYDDEDFGHLDSKAIVNHLEDAMDKAVYNHKLLHIEGKCFEDINIQVENPIKVGPVGENEQTPDDERVYAEDHLAAGFTPPRGSLSIHGPRGNEARTLRELVDYADAADPQLIDAIHELACLCESDAPTPLIQDKLRALASEVQPQDAVMADDLRHVIDDLDDKLDN
jgi:hypothetical protein